MSITLNAVANSLDWHPPTHDDLEFFDWGRSPTLPVLKDEELITLAQYCNFADHDGIAVVVRLLQSARQMQELLSEKQEQFTVEPRIRFGCNQQVTHVESFLTIALLELLQSEGLLTPEGQISLEAIAQRSHCLLHGVPWRPSV